MPCFPAESAAFTQRQQLKACALAAPLQVAFCERSPAEAQALRENIAAFTRPLPAAVTEALHWQTDEQDVFAWRPPVAPTGDSLILMNPPYGLRLKYDGWDTAKPWSRLGRWLRDLAHERQGRTAGVVLVPNEPAWRAFLSGLGPQARFATRHMNHGGIDLRCVGFLFTKGRGLA
jgi:hypothetical protein